MPSDDKANFKERFGDWPNSPQGKSYGMEGKTLGDVDKENATADQFKKSAAPRAYAAGGVVMPPTMGVSSAYPPPPGQRKEGPRAYGKKE